jgi:acyl-CoA reductase-like NAD-dependent aldehyde dehydrogenase
VDVLHDDKLFIGSRWVAPRSTERADVVSPYTGTAVRSLPRPTIADAADAVSAAAGAFDAWSALPFEERHAVLARFGTELDKRLDDINRAWAVEAGMPLRNGQDLTSAASALWNRALEESLRAPWVEVRHTSMGDVEVRHEPIGPTVGIVAFNGPHMQFALAIIPALLAGNTMIIKLPPENRLLGYLFADAADEAGFPVGVLSILAGDADVSAYLVGHAEVAAVHFTGGTEVGTAVMRACADRAAIVAADADLDHAIPALVDSMALYSGQICVAMTRLLVAREIHDEVVARLVDGLRGLRTGDPLDPATSWGPLAGERFRDRAEGYIARAVAAGATLAHGGGRPAGFGGFFLEPTLLTGVTNDMEAARDEIFGPVFCVLAYDTLDEAVALSNDSRYGLSGSIFTTDEAIGRDVARRVRSGVFVINGTFPCLAAPFGGVKQSGFGREGGPEGLFALTQLRAITLDAAPSETATTEGRS